MEDGESLQSPQSFTIDSPTCHASGDPELLHGQEAQRGG